MKHRQLALATAFSMVAALAACGSDSDDNGGPSGSGGAGTQGTGGGSASGGNAPSDGGSSASGGSTGSGGASASGGTSTSGGAAGASSGGSAVAGEAYEGSWQRASLTVDGASQQFCNSQLDLTPTSYKSFTTGGGAANCDCAVDGTLAVDGSNMTWVITGLTGQLCGTINQVGYTYSSSFAVSSDGNTFTNTTVESGVTIIETYTRIAGGTGGTGGTGGGTGGSGSSAQSCNGRSTAFGTCIDFTGTGLTDAEKSGYCQPALGVASTDPCPTANLVGSCVLGSGSAKELSYRYYSDTTPAFTAQSAEQTCSNIPNSTWVP